MSRRYLWHVLFVLSCSTLFAQEIYVLEGSIAEKYPVKMLLCRNGDKLSGSYYYLKSGTLISLEGFMRSDTQADFFEFQDPAKPSGQFYGSLTQKGFDGKWLNLDSRKELSAFLKTSKETGDEFWRPTVDFQFEAQPDPLSDFSIPRFHYEGNFAVQKKLEELFSFKDLTGETWDEVKEKFAREDFPMGIVHMSGKVTCNKDYILSVIMSLGGMGAHGSYWDTRINVNLHAARKLIIGDLLNMNEVGPLAEFCRRTMEERLMEKTQDIENDGLDIHDLVNGDLFKIEDLSNFSVIEDEGIAFCASWEFPHFAKAYEPDRVILISFSELAPYIRIGGPLEAFY